MVAKPAPWKHPYSSSPVLLGTCLCLHVFSCVTVHLALWATVESRKMSIIFRLNYHNIWIISCLFCLCSFCHVWICGPVYGFTILWILITIFPFFCWSGSILFLKILDLLCMCVCVRLSIWDVSPLGFILVTLIASNVLFVHSPQALLFVYAGPVLPYATCTNNYVR